MREREIECKKIKVVGEPSVTTQLREAEMDEEGKGNRRRKIERQQNQRRVERRQVQLTSILSFSLSLPLPLSLSLSRVYLVCQASLDVTLFCETCSSLLLLLHLPFTA